MTSYSFKVVLLGQGCVGKTSLVLRYVSNVFNDSHQSTLQASFLRKQLYLEQDLVKLNIWDTAGQEKFHALGPIYYREANGALLVYDVTSADSLRKVRDWVRELNKMLGPRNVQLAIIGNKVDLLAGNELQRQQSNELINAAVQLSDELPNAQHYLTSAKVGGGIGDLFASLSRRMVAEEKRRLAAAAASKSQLGAGGPAARSLASSLRPKQTIALSAADAEGGSGGAAGRRRRGEAAAAASSCQC